MRNIDQLLATIHTLRGPNGCAWDKKQTHQSLIRYLDEEAAEVSDAILQNNPELLKEELGDLLLQIVLHAEIASEKGEFDFDTIAKAINEKMIHRHPHVFSDVVYQDEAEQKAAWQALKAEEKNHENETSVLSSVKKSFSGLNVAHSIQANAAKVGFDFDDANLIVDKISEELAEVVEAIDNVANDKDALTSEIGDLLFSVVNLARYFEINPEEAIQKTNQKFIKRFSYLENKLQDRLENASLEEMDQLWIEAKQYDK